MSERSPKRSFAARPADPESWIKAPDRHAARGQAAEDYSARLTIDVTTDMRGRIKIAAFRRGVKLVQVERRRLVRVNAPQRRDDFSDTVGRTSHLHPQLAHALELSAPPDGRVRPRPAEERALARRGERAG